MAGNEIVPADTIVSAFERNQYNGDIPSSSNTTGRSLPCGNEDHAPQPFESERLPVALAQDIQRFLRVANLVEQEEPRIAYLCNDLCGEQKLVFLQAKKVRRNEFDYTWFKIRRPISRFSNCA